MVYRAKITHIQSWIENHYNTNSYDIVHDKNDVYIEVKNVDEADLIEAMNKTQMELQLLKSEWYEKFNEI